MRHSLNNIFFFLTIGLSSICFAENSLEQMLLNSEVFLGRPPASEDMLCNSFKTACAACVKSSCAMSLSFEGKNVVFDLSEVESSNLGKIGHNRSIESRSSKVLNWDESRDDFRVLIETTIYSEGVRYRARENAYVDPTRGPLWR